MCVHCYHESSRIRHPVQYTFSKVSQLPPPLSHAHPRAQGMKSASPWMSMSDIKMVLEAEAREEDTHSTIDEEPEDVSGAPAHGSLMWSPIP